MRSGRWSVCVSRATRINTKQRDAAKPSWRGICVRRRRARQMLPGHTKVRRAHKKAHYDPRMHVVEHRQAGMMHALAGYVAKTPQDQRHVLARGLGNMRGAGLLCMHM